MSATTLGVGVDAPVDWPPGATLLDLFAEQVATGADRPAMRARSAGGAWQTISWREYGATVSAVAAALAQLGVEPGDRVGLLSWNRPEWHEADLGILTAGAVSVPVYPTSAPEQVAYVLAHSESRVCFVETHEQLARVLEHRAELPRLERVVLFDDGAPLDDPVVLSFEELCAIGTQHEAPSPRVTPDHVATLVYTSGTTGPPKGAVITHGNVMATLRSVTRIVPLAPTDRFLSFLPLSHITERSVSHFGLIAAGGETWFARSVSTVAEDLPDCRPTIFFAVPRVWEKFKEAIVEQVDALPGWRGNLARRYLALATRGPDSLPLLERAQWHALDRLVGAKLRHQIGLDRARILVSGAAPVHPDLLHWFAGLGMRIAEGYGQTEVALATTLNPPDAIRVGTVGPPLPGVIVRVADDGEILVRGDNVCRGYWRDERGTRELLEGGWLHSGDLGGFDDHGYVRITGRKKDLIITAHGKNIAPQGLETDLKQGALIGQAVVIGEGRRYLTALLALDAEAVTHWADSLGKHTLSFEELSRDPDLLAEIGAAVDAANAHHARVEHVRKWRVLPHELSVAAGELTPTLKVKRAVVSERYADLVEDMYAEEAG